VPKVTVFGSCTCDDEIFVPAATLTMIKWPVLRTPHVEAHIFLATFQDHPTGQARWLLEFVPNGTDLPGEEIQRHFAAMRVMSSCW
jgi:hypothetical protein